MNCAQVKNLLSAYLDEEVKPSLRDEIKLHLGGCPACHKEAQAMSQAWDMLGALPEHTPSPNYIGRFWTMAGAQGAPHASNWLQGLKSLFENRRFVPVATALSVMLIVFSVNLVKESSIERELSRMNSADIEMIENIDLAKNIDTIKDLDFLQDMEGIDSKGGMYT